jgi:exodeoxyribonuclease V alpha subunit
VAITTQQTDTLSGQVERITFHSAESGFCVLRVKIQSEDDLTVVGYNAAATAGEHIEAVGQWVNDRECGHFKAQTLRFIPPATLKRLDN